MSIRNWLIHMLGGSTYKEMVASYRCGYDIGYNDGGRFALSDDFQEKLRKEEYKAGHDAGRDEGLAAAQKTIKELQKALDEHGWHDLQVSVASRDAVISELEEEREALGKEAYQRGYDFGYCHGYDKGRGLFG